MLHKIHTKYFDGGSSITRETKKPKILDPGRTAQSKRNYMIKLQTLRAPAPCALSLIAFPDGAFQRSRNIARVLRSRFSGRDGIWVVERRACVMRRRRRRGDGSCAWNGSRFCSSYWKSCHFNWAVFLNLWFWSWSHRPLAWVIFFYSDIRKLIQKCCVREIFELMTQQSLDSF